MAAEVSEEVRGLIAAAQTGTLATLLEGGAPYASLVSLATDEDGRPIFLLSRLALHTRNLDSDPRASLLVCGEVRASGDPLAEARVSLLGRVEPLADRTLRGRYLAAHPEAETYVDFADFRFFRMTVERAHLVAGFGRIVDLPGAALAG